MSGPASVLARQRRDHVELDRLLNQLGRHRGGAQAPVLLAMSRLVFPHAFAEESVLWPVIRRVHPDGQALTLQNEKEHQRINELWTRLEEVEPGTPESDQLLNDIVPLLRLDVRDEEDALLPALQAKLSPTQLRLLGYLWEAVRRFAPTRPHPIVARRPPGNVLAALPLTVIDRLRDRIEARLHAQPNAPALYRLDAGLKQAGHALERLPGMKTGEDPVTRVPGRGVGWPTFGLVAALGAAALVLQRRRDPALA
jgi:hypothetical protein